eukprot:c21151_g1_i1.p1 GENE.c21151_g1_i1~~c21151_g1_i1.p1  ORF type:complete len:442 (+),score=109.95 c21151_g1_i1:75-1400(+)
MIFTRLFERTFASFQWCWKVNEFMDVETRTEEILMGKRTLKKFCTFLIVLAQVVVATLFISVFFALYISADEPACFQPKYSFLIVLVVSIAWGLLIEFCNYSVFVALARVLNDWEGYSNKSQKERHFIIKIFAFFFVDCYLWYFLLCLYWIPLLQYSNSQEQKPSLLTSLPWCDGELLQQSEHVSTQQWMDKASSGLFFYLLGTQLFSLFVEDFLPHYRKKESIGELGENLYGLANSQVSKLQKNTGKLQRSSLALVDRRSNLNFETRLSESEIKIIYDQSKLEMYGTMIDWADMTTQFGYIIFFSILCPLAPFVCWINNIFEIRGDIFKLCNTMARPIPSKMSTISTWLEIQKVLVYVSALITSAILVLGTDFVDRWFSFEFDPDVSPPVLGASFKIYLAIILEHILLAWLYLAGTSLPQRPNWLLRAELEHKRETVKAI